MKPLEAARAYAKKGWPVFPVRARGKVPATANGYLDASTDEAKINEWWNDEPNYNLGIVTSRRSGIWVLDEDVEDGVLIGEMTLTELCAKHGPLPPHPISETPKGGRHHLFAYPDDGKDLPRSIRFAPGLDALGSRMEDDEERAGYFIAWPSIRDDGEYLWKIWPKDVPPPQAPEWLVALIRSHEEKRPEGIPHIEPVLGQTNAYGRRALDEECDRIASCPPGSQDVTLYERSVRIGSIAAHGDIDIGEAFNSLVDAGMRMTNAGRPWTRREVERKVRRAMEFGARDPYVPRPRERQTPPPRGMKPRLITSDQKKVAEPPPEPDDWEYELTWSLKADGSKRPKEAINCKLTIERHPMLTGVLDYDEFSDQMRMVKGLPGDTRPIYPRLLTDEDVTEWTAWLNTTGISPSYDMVQRHMHAWAKRNGRDPLKEYLNSLVWDGKQRIDNWLTYYCAAESNDYTKAVGRKFLIGAVARGLSPGAKVDSMMIFEGQQGIGKSTAARALFGDQFFSDQIADVRTKEGAISLQGVWCIEVAEMDKFGRIEANAVKSFLTHTEDRYRPHYGKHMVSRPRRCVFFGTINPDGTGYLRDPTGNRRFWPIAVQSIDIEGLKADRDQLWAEAVIAFKSGETWWLDGEQEKLAAIEQDARQEEELREVDVIEWVESQRPQDGQFAFTVSECLKGIGITGAHQNSKEANSVRRIIKKIGCYARSNWANRQGRFWVHRRMK